jgi:hypothetical protein
LYERKKRPRRSYNGINGNGHPRESVRRKLSSLNLIVGLVTSLYLANIISVFMLLLRTASLTRTSKIKSHGRCFKLQ